MRVGHRHVGVVAHLRLIDSTAQRDPAKDARRSGGRPGGVGQEADRARPRVRVTISARASLPKSAPLQRAVWYPVGNNGAGRELAGSVVQEHRCRAAEEVGRHHVHVAVASKSAIPAPGRDRRSLLEREAARVVVEEHAATPVVRHHVPATVAVSCPPRWGWTGLTRGGGRGRHPSLAVVDGEQIADAPPWVTGPSLSPSWSKSRWLRRWGLSRVLSWYWGRSSRCPWPMYIERCCRLR